MPEFSSFDSRGYRTVDPRAGYAEWVGTYEDTVEDAMDLELLAQLTAVDWSGDAADLGCGTGRAGAWLVGRGISAVDGVDLTPEMLGVAEGRGVYRLLVEGDVADSGLAARSYVSFHPHFLMTTGMPTHFENAAGEKIAIETHVHLLSEHVGAGLGAGLTLAELRERVVDDEWVALKPSWERWRDHPVSLAAVWRAP